MTQPDREPESTSIARRWEDDGRYRPAITPPPVNQPVRHQHANGTIHEHRNGEQEHEHDG